jgi:membrane fusion protein (multidrug efflux system)
MKRTLILSGIFLLLIGLILVKVFFDHGRKKPEIASDANPAIPVEARVVGDTSVQFSCTTIGTILANESVEIVSEINRKIISILMKEGSYVAKNQLLFILDDADIVARINKLTVELNLAEANEAREKPLLGKGGISQEQYDEVLNRLNTLKAEIEVLKVDLSKTEIRAPFSGKIGLRHVSEGALIHPNTVLASLQDVSRIKIDFAVPERYANDLHLGSRVTFTTDYSPDLFYATVEAIEPAVDLKTRTIGLRAISDNKAGKLVPGASVKVELQISTLEKSIFVPTSALVPSIKGYNVFILKSGEAKSLTVKTGLRNRESVQITEGLSKGDTLITTNLLRVRQGTRLKIIKLH